MDGLVAACRHPETTIEKDTETDLLRNLNDVFCSLQLPQQMSLLLHTDIVRFYDLFTMDASTDGLVVAHGHCCYV